MNLLKRISENFMQQVMSFVGIESPSLEQRKLAKEIVEAIRERQEETNQAK
jgi:hypothetical protein|nr:MAG TPA: hypothetical protein [Caudoviricetes sp.]